MSDHKANDHNTKVLEALIEQQGETLKALVSMMDRKFADEAKDRASALKNTEQDRIDRKELVSTVMNVVQGTLPIVFKLFAGKNI